MPGWRNFGIAMLVLVRCAALSRFSPPPLRNPAAFGSLPAATVAALGMAGWVAITIVPALARRTSLRWFVYQVDYRLTREGIIYLGAVFILVLAAVNTGNNLLFMILACLLAGILISGVLSRVVLTGVDLKFDMPEHIFAEQPVLAELELRNEKQTWPSFSLLVVGETKKSTTAGSHAPRLFSLYPAAKRRAAKSGADFPRTRRVPPGRLRNPHSLPVRLLRENAHASTSNIEIIVYPRVAATEQFYEVLPLLSGEMASYFRGRGHELHSLRDYQPNDSARLVDWKVTANTGRVMVREFAREDERRVMLVLDPFMGPARADLGPSAEFEHADRFERAVSMAACIAWHFHEINSVMQFRTDRFATPMATASEIIYDALRELALIEPIYRPPAEHS